MPGESPQHGATPPISEAQLIEIARGEERAKKLAFAGKLASFNGVVIGVFAFLSLASAIFDPWSLLLAAPLAAIAFVELRGSRQLARYERQGLMLLVGNQLALIALVTVYALLQIRSALSEPSPLAELMSQGAALPQDLAGTDLSGLGDFDDIYRSAAVGFYGLVIVLTALSQGACALYYWTRLKHLDELITSTPPWVLGWLKARRH